jgi:hypothetical protein
MDEPQKPDAETTRKPLVFPSQDVDADAGAASVARIEGARATLLRRRRMEWLEGTWVILAWIVAANRVSFTVRQREVFGFEAMTAFLLVVSMPIIRAPYIAAAVRGIVRALRSRKGAEPAGTDAQPRVLRRRRAEKGRRKGT